MDAAGATLGGALGDLDRQFPGIRFRMIDEQGAIRPHVKPFVNRVQARSLDAALGAGDEVLTLSGG